MPAEAKKKEILVASRAVNSSGLAVASQCDTTLKEREKKGVVVRRS